MPLLLLNSPFWKKRKKKGMVATMMELVSGRTSATAHRPQYLLLSNIHWVWSSAEQYWKKKTGICDYKWAMKGKKREFWKRASRNETRECMFFQRRVCWSVEWLAVLEYKRHFFGMNKVERLRSEIHQVLPISNQNRIFSLTMRLQETHLI
ncbi:hypothetical protein AVEN_248673-1 [Araneus ventricosus]|uniref:Uncharacterized protein n=1 Tax=Araneus ventricosus TaxID=182803 RepID=A0A4Y2BZZ8_ARAVE|nr:hypothetical protein AVEN_248673-1 [Araneus ventricosus]